MSKKNQIVLLPLTWNIQYNHCPKDYKGIPRTIYCTMCSDPKIDLTWFVGDLYSWIFLDEFKKDWDAIINYAKSKKYSISGEILGVQSKEIDGEVSDKDKKKVKITFKNGTYTSSDCDFPIGDNYIDHLLPRTNKPLPSNYYPNKKQKSK